MQHTTANNTNIGHQNDTRHLKVLEHVFTLNNDFQSPSDNTPTYNKMNGFCFFPKVCSGSA